MATDMDQRPGALRRYLPLIAVVVAVAVVVGVVAVVRGGGDDDDGGRKTATAAEIPISFDEAKAAGTVDDYDWGPNCDTSRGRIALPALQAPQCVPAWKGGDNGGATSPGVTASTIRIGLYTSQPDDQINALLKAAGAYDTPKVVNDTRKDYLGMLTALAQTYGRRLELVPIRATGTGTDAVAARADAIRAATEQKVFAVIGGPLQTKAFAEELAKRRVLCIGTCLLSQPEDFYAKYRDYVYGTGPSPEQTYRHTIEILRKQLAGKVASFAGDPDLQRRTRRFALVAYDTPDGDFTLSRQHFLTELRAAGIRPAEVVTYFLDLAKAQEDARTMVSKLKSSGATSIVFTGDPLMPKYLSEEATRQQFFPEWILSGTVLADTTTLGRLADPQQWAHAISYTYLQVRTPQERRDAWVAHQWWFGTNPPSENSYEITFGDALLLVAGIHAAGPHLTPQTFHAGLYKNSPAVKPVEGMRTAVIDFDDEGGFWDRPDNNGVDNATIMWWNPDAVGPDETGTVGKGMWEFVDGGRRYLPGKWPTTPLPLFDLESTTAVTVYDDPPPDLTPPTYPTNPASPQARTQPSPST
jgi:hypothetical protein